MAKFENRYGVRKIVYKQKCRCFCPIGKTDYTNEFTVTMEPAEIIPDYCEIDKFIRECLEGESLVIEDPSWIMVESAVNDAPHGNVVVMV